MKRIARVTEPQFALIVLLVCAPVLLGLCLILLGWINAALDTITDLLMAQTLLAYAAMGMGVLHLLLLLARPSRTIVLAIEGALYPVFLVGLLSYLAFVQGEGIVVLSILGAVVAIVMIAWLAGRRTDRIDYGRH